LQQGELCYNYMPGIDQNREFKIYLNLDVKTSTELTSLQGKVHAIGCACTCSVVAHCSSRNLAPPWRPRHLRTCRTKRTWRCHVVLQSLLLFNNPPRTFAANGEPLSLLIISLLICCRLLGCVYPAIMAF
jgi:hypothetical protein